MRFYQPPPALRRFFTTFYYIDLVVAGGGLVQDYLHPEWANLRFHSGGLPTAKSLNGTSVSGSNFTASGPSAHAVHFRITSSRMWGIGLLPLGWAKYVGVPAHELANVVADGHEHPAFEPFASLAQTVFGPEPDEQGELERITQWFLDQPSDPVPGEDFILAIHKALIDPDIATVAALVESLDVGQRTLERMCLRVFGFAPKILLRRQRFMRSLSQYMLDPSLKWIGAMDSAYHDQAQFVREFNDFMGMGPGVYAAMEHPIISAIMRQRVFLDRPAAQTLDPPGALLP
ncbi:helix-turn-helix domain-containing protein [Altererythrobacter salegens]|uniref:Helix-turn-helix domain-containing protein n=1 Tax=Croceibacterium salegens TaxID=1737568 RepID=A0A6I4SW33_9SPHN|nr:helix-turn-helix domain-containing protein [Croceibacterium salegens]MXO60324.1 helix-turn-helix domain-containing protein [Croceibacterium salegens]